MAERTESSIRIDAPPGRVMEVVTDLEAYPEWADGIRSVAVDERDGDGRPARASFHVASAGVEARYTLVYRYPAGGLGVSWTTAEASGAVRDIRGEYVVEPDRDGTRVAYRLRLEPAISLPGFLTRRAERTIVDTALAGLRRRVEFG